jgi:hypothetical protein
LDLTYAHEREPHQWIILPCSNADFRYGIYANNREQGGPVLMAQRGVASVPMSLNQNRGGRIEIITASKKGDLTYE